MQAFRALAEPPGPGPVLVDRRPVPADIALGGTSPARSGRWWVALDVLVVAAAGAAALALARQAALPWPGAVAGISAATALLAVVVDLARHGRSPGHRVLGSRSVDAATGFPGTLATTVLRARVVDLRSGRDPLRLQPQGGPAVRPERWRSGTGAGGGAPVLLTFDDGLAASLVGATVVGRNPSLHGGALHVLQVPDLSRTMSKNHALLEPDGPAVWVTDLGSTNGTTLVAEVPAGPERRRLPAGVRVAARPGDRLELGDRVLVLGRSHPARPTTAAPPTATATETATATATATATSQDGGS